MPRSFTVNDLMGEAKFQSLHPSPYHVDPKTRPNKCSLVAIGSFLDVLDYETSNWMDGTREDIAFDVTDPITVNGQMVHSWPLAALPAHQFFW